MARKITYRSLLRQRAAVAGLTLGLVTVMIGVSIDLFFTGRRSTIPATTRRLIVPLNPQLDIEVIESIEGYEPVSIESARQGVFQPVIPTPEPIPEFTSEQSVDFGQEFVPPTQPSQTSFPEGEIQPAPIVPTEGSTGQGEETFLQP